MKQKLNDAGLTHSSSDLYFESFDHLRIRYGIWESPPYHKKGTVIILGGRVEFLEKYSETIAELNAKHFDVFSFDWRGQGLSGRLLRNRHKGYVKSYDDYLQELEIFLDRIVKPQAVRPLIILAHSMGAHLTLRYLHDHDEDICGAILLASLIDINTPPFPTRVARWITRAAMHAGLEHCYAIGCGDYLIHQRKFFQNRLTSDPQRFMDEINAIRKNPDLAIGGVTYGWLAATFESIDLLKTPGYAAGIETPVLMISAGSDKIISVKAQVAISASIPSCRFVTIPEARHEILKENDSIRNIFWNAFDRFIADKCLMR